MGNSKDKDGLTTGSLTLPPHTPPLVGFPGHRSFSWLHLAALGGGGGLWQALRFSQGHLSWLNLLFLLRGTRQAVVPGWLCQQPVRALREPQEISQAAVPPTHWSHWWVV